MEQLPDLNINSIDLSSPDMVELPTPSLNMTLPDFSKELITSTVKEIDKDNLTNISSINEIGLFETPSNKMFNTNSGFYSIHESHTQMRDGSFIPKFENFIWGTNNEERFAQSQSTSSKWINGLTKAGATVGQMFVQGTVGTIYGLGTALSKGSLEAFYDNDFSNELNDWNETVKAYNPNFRTEHEKNLSLGSQLGTANFWAEDVIGGAAFTVGALASEAVWAYVSGGASLTSAASRYGMKRGMKKAIKKGLVDKDNLNTVRKLANESSKVKSAINGGIANGRVSAEAMKTIGMSSTKWANAAKFAGSTRFLLTSSAMEAGFEALNFKNLATQDFYDHFRSQNRMPTDEELMEFEKTLDGKANRVFGWNMAILMPSNLAMFGQYFKAFNGIKNTAKKATITGTSFSNKNIFKLGVKQLEDGSYTAIKANLGNKLAKIGSRLSKGAFTEGIFEEGGQGIASSTYANFVKASYDDKNFGHLDTLAKSFEHSVGEQFSSKEGLKEILIGGIIGAGFGGAQSIPSTMREYSNQKKIADLRNNAVSLSNNNLTSLYTGTDIASKVSRSNRSENTSKKLDKAVQEKDYNLLEIAKTEQIISLMEQANALGDVQNVEALLKRSIEDFDSKHAQNMLGLSEEDVAIYKQTAVENLTSTIERYKTSRKFAESLFGAARIGGITKGSDGKKFNTQNLVNATAYAMTMQHTAETVIQDSVKVIREATSKKYNISEEINHLIGLENASKDLRYEYDRLVKLKEEGKVELERLENEITLAANKDTTRGERYKSLSTELSEASAKLNETEAKLNIVKEQIISENGEIVGIGGLNDISIEERVKRIQENLEKLPTEERLEIEETFSAALKAIEYSKSFHQMVGNLIDPKFRYKTYTGIFGGLSSTTMSINDKVKETLINWVDNASVESTQASISMDTRGLNKIQAIVKSKLLKGPKTVEELIEEIEKDLENAEDNLDKSLLEAALKELRENPNFLQSIYDAANTAEESESKEPETVDDVEENPLPSDTLVTDEIYEEFLNTGSVPEDVMISIAEKVKNTDEITPQEYAIITALTDELELALSILRDEGSNSEDIISEDNKEDLEETSNESSNTSQESPDSRPNKEVVIKDSSIDKISLEEKLKDAKRDARNRIKKFYKDSPLLNNLDEFDENNVTDVDKPTEDEVVEYAELYNKGDNLTPEEKKRSEELREKLFRYGVSRDLNEDGTNLLDLIEYEASLHRAEEEESIKSDITTEDMGKVITKAEGPNYSTYVTKVNEGTMVSKGGLVTHFITITHLTDLVEKKNGKRPTLYVNLEDSDGNPTGEVEYSTQEELDSLENKTYTFALVDDNADTIVSGRMSRGKATLSEPLQEITNVRVVSYKNEKHKFDLVFEKNTDGTYTPMKNYFQHEKAPGQKTINTIKEGDKVTLTHNINDPYNVKILEELGLQRIKSDRSSFDHHERIRSLPDYDQYVKRAYVGVKFKNANIGYISAGSSSNEKTTDFEDVRTAVVRDGEVKLPVKEVYRNYPNTTLNEEGDMILHEIDRSHEKFRGVGVVQKDSSGTLSFNDSFKEDVNHQFTELFLGDEDQGAYSIIEVGKGNFYSFPISIDPIMVDLTEELSNIINSNFVSRETKATKINEFISVNNLPVDMVTPENVYDINIEELGMVQLLPTLESLEDDKSITLRTPLNMDRPFFLPKFKLDFKQAEYKGKNNTEVKLNSKKRKVYPKVKKDSTKTCKK